MSTQGRVLVLCFDGTDDAFDGTNTNIVKLFNLFEKDEPNMITYYQPGVGTYVRPGMWMPIAIWLSKILDQAFATYLDGHIMAGYRFLMNNWRPGDRICFFGFSRGAYTARCLAGMLDKVGLLPMANQEQVTFAYRMYKNQSKKGWQQSAAFKRTFGRSVVIDYVGCFDTVSSVGVLIPRHLPFSSANTIVKTFRHALALDEHRFRFSPNLWHRDAGDDAGARMDPENASRPPTHEKTDLEASGYSGDSDVKEVWFAGCHSDIGGGDVSDDTPHSAAFVSLRWMITQTIKCNTGIVYKRGALESLGFDLASSNVEDHNTSTVPDPALGRHGSVRIPGAKEAEGSGIGRIKEVTGEAKVRHQDDQNAKQDDKDAQRIGPPLQVTPHSQNQTHSEEGTLVNRSNGERQGFSHKMSASHERDATYQIRVAGESHAQREQHDVVAPIHDELKRQPLWWLLEITPMIESYQDTQGKWHRKPVIHFGRSRKIRSTNEPMLHISVKQRMESGIGYRPRAKMAKGIENAKWTE